MGHNPDRGLLRITLGETPGKKYDYSLQRLPAARKNSWGAVS